MPYGRIARADGSPAPGVRVAHGAAVGLSGEDGSYSLEGEGNHVVVTRPDGWTADPWFHPADESPASFVLRPVDVPSPLRFAQVTDLHLSARPPSEHTEVPDGPDPVVDAVARVVSSNPGCSMIIATGDLTDTGLDSEYAMVATVLASAAMEVFAVPGNHDHMAGAPRFLITDRGYGTNHGDPSAWEKHFGPRWFSFDRGGVHFVVVDWHMWELGIDRQVQERWIAADLASNFGMPWVLLSHDQMTAEFLAPLPPPLATFSGHWHTSRTVTVGTTLHVSTPPLTFGGLDHGRPAATIVEWDGRSLAVRHHEEPIDEPPPSAIKPIWSLALAPKGGLVGPVALTNEVVLAVTWDDAWGEGAIDAVRARSGERVWRRVGGRAVKAAPAIAGDQVLLVDVAGGVRALDVADGSVRWEVQPASPLRTWCWASPAIEGDLVIVATPTRVVAYRLDDGSVRWERTGLVPHANLLAHSSPMVIDGTVVMGFWPFTPAFFGLSVIDGSTVWTLDEPEGEPIEGATGRGTALGPWSPVGPGVVSGDRVVFPAAGGWICLDPSSGQMWWRSTGAGRFRPGRPLPVDDGVIVVSPDLVSRLRLADGSPVWKAGFPPGGMALAPYRITPHVGTAGPGLIGDIAVVPGLDGAMHRLDVAEGADRGSLALGIRSAAAPLIIDDVVVLLGVDGSLAAFARDEVVA